MDSAKESVQTFEDFYSVLIKTIGEYDVPAFRAARDEYRSLRKDLLSNNGLRPIMPGFVIDCSTLDEFSSFIKTKGSTTDRRLYIKREFYDPVSSFLYVFQLISQQTILE